MEYILIHNCRLSFPVCPTFAKASVGEAFADLFAGSLGVGELPFQFSRLPFPVCRLPSAVSRYYFQVFSSIFECKYKPNTNRRA
jgi:hypothetical protein